jgi:membrane protein DedA with SNARE-associated domain
MFWENAQFDVLTDWAYQFIVHQSLLAPFLLLFLEEVGVPMPIPGDLFIMVIGYQVGKGAISYAFAFVLFLFIVLTGSTILYTISERWGNELVRRVGKYIHVDEKRLLAVEKKFRKYGPLVIIFGRHIPGFRIPITIFSGMSEVTYKTFIISTFISVVLWIPFYLSLGQKVGKKVLTLFHASPWYLVTLLIPLLLFLLSCVLTYRNRKK